ncbi:MAG TPA: pantetheine-phosphate adenylyltransferase [Candidatus Binatia bacterium]|nr:pantetheine-phosphate adenylyltransferase [Candidatus Binatia bacterium]
MTQRVALYPGSFDPITTGHLDILERAATIFDRVVVSVLRHPEKEPLFSVEERLELIRDATREMPGLIDVDSFDGLTVVHATNVGATAIVRGLRAVSDFESEFQMALMNRRLNPGIDTVFLMTSAANVFMSSSVVKEISELGGDVEEFVPPATAQALRRRFGRAR